MRTTFMFSGPMPPVPPVPPATGGSVTLPYEAGPARVGIVEPTSRRTNMAYDPTGTHPKKRDEPGDPTVVENPAGT